MDNGKRLKISFSLKFVSATAAFVGIIWSFFAATADGYSHWSKRLLYFTLQSNVWIAVTFIAILLATRVKKLRDNGKLLNVLYILKYVFTVSITVTGFIFCAVLAPGSANAGYNAWTVSSILTHVVVPVFSVADYFVDPRRPVIKKSQVLYATVPPFIYCIFATVLCVMKVDFGRGEPFPYFFFNYYSPAGVFGTSDVMPYRIGSFYWIVFILFIVIGIGTLYRILGSKKEK